jgi:hypothetical protein
MRTGPHHTGSGHVSTPDPRLGPVRGPGMFYLGTLGPPCGRPRPHTGGSGSHSRGPACTSGGPRPTSEVWPIHPGVWDQPWGFGQYIQGSSALPWGFGLTIDALEYTTLSGHVVASDPPMWQGRALLWTQNSRLRLGQAMVWSRTTLLPRD